MKNFIFYSPTKIIFGKGQIAAIAEEIPKTRKILLTYGQGSIKDNGIYNQVVTALKEYNFIEFGGLEPNPTYETLIQAIELARKEEVDFLLAVGGGSVLDGTKFISAAINFAGDPWDILSKGASVKTATPVGTILTLPASGSEMNAYAVISHRRLKQKLSFCHELLNPVFSVLDPSITFSLPAKQVANGIVDSFTHAMEQYLTYNANAPLQDRLAESILQTLIEEGPKTLGDLNDYNSRANIMWCCTMASNELIGLGVPQDWATHAIGHQITALHGLDHARTLAIVLPSVMYFKRDKKEEKLLQYAHRVWNIKGSNKNKIIDKAILKTRDFFEELGLPTSLAAYNINLKQVESIPQRLAAIGRNKIGEHKDIESSDVKEILALCA